MYINIFFFILKEAYMNRIIIASINKQINICKERYPSFYQGGAL